jgi:hypothetical protein
MNLQGMPSLGSRLSRPVGSIPTHEDTRIRPVHESQRLFVLRNAARAKGTLIALPPIQAKSNSSPAALCDQIEPAGSTLDKSLKSAHF